MVLYEVLTGTVPYDEPVASTTTANTGAMGHLLSHSYALIASGKRPMLPSTMTEDHSMQWIVDMVCCIYVYVC